MSLRFTELDWRETPMGVISLRRRRDPGTGEDVYEVKLDDDYLMSSLFTVAEVELARLALAELSSTTALDVAVGGLGLGYTARAVLDDARVGSLVVLDALDDVIRWHADGLVPLGPAITNDSRCRLVHADFIAAALSSAIDPSAHRRLFDAIVVDIDHSPRHVLHPSHARFYEPAGAAALAAQLKPAGVFALWSDDPPDAAYTDVLAGVFSDVRTHVVPFRNEVAGVDATNTVYVAHVG
jgi:spermidine synthase